MITPKQAIEMGKQLIAQAERAERLGATADFAVVVNINDELYSVDDFHADERNPYFFIDASRASEAPKV